MPDPAYQAYLTEGNDIGGIDVGFLVKTSRVSVTSVTQYGLTATYINPTTTLPETLWDRPPLVLEAVMNPAGGASFPVTVIVNHLRSLSGVDDPADGPRVRAKRRAEAEYLADLIQARLGPSGSRTMTRPWPICAAWWPTSASPSPMHRTGASLDTNKVGARLASPLPTTWAVPKEISPPRPWFLVSPVRGCATAMLACTEPQGAAALAEHTKPR